MAAVAGGVGIVLGFVLGGCGGAGGDGFGGPDAAPPGSNTPPGQVEGIGAPDADGKAQVEDTATAPPWDAGGADASSDVFVPPTDAVIAPTDAVTPLEDTALDAGCVEGAATCLGLESWRCTDGEWRLDELCGQACVGGSCTCSPSCQGKECGPDGCGGSCGLCPGGECTQGGQCKTTAYTAIYVEDRWNGTCSSSASSGADIVGVTISDAQGNVLGSFTQVVAAPGTQGCINNYADPNAVLGPPGSDELALQGGWVAGTFDAVPDLVPGLVVTVFELGAQGGGTDEPFAIYRATDLGCPGTPGAREACLDVITEHGLGTTTVVIP